MGQGWGGIIIGVEVGVVTGRGEGLLLSDGWVGLRPELYNGDSWELILETGLELGKNCLHRASSCS